MVAVVRMFLALDPGSMIIHSVEACIVILQLCTIHIASL